MSKSKPKKAINLADIARRGKVTQQEWDDMNKDGNSRKNRPVVFDDKKKKANKEQARKKDKEID